MSASKCCIWLLLADVVLLLPYPAIAATRAIDDFNSLGWLDNWSLVLGEEFRGAKGVLIPDRGVQGGGASLEFDFSCSRVIGPCDPRYIAASRSFDPPIPGEVMSLWIRCNACEPRFRITDATGQRLSYGAVALPLAVDSVDAWHRVVISLRTDIVKYQDGANDGKLHPGIREIRVIAQEDGILAAKGALQFDQLRLHESMAEASGREISLTFPTSSFRAPSDSIARTSDILGGVKSPDPARAAAAGFSHRRKNLSWARVEERLGEYDFTRYDRMVQEAQSSGMGIVFMLGLGQPRLYGGRTHTAAHRAADRRFCEIRRSGGRALPGQAGGLRDMERTQLSRILAAGAVRSRIWQIVEARDRRYPACEPGCDDHYGGAERLGRL